MSVWREIVARAIEREPPRPGSLPRLRDEPGFTVLVGGILSWLGFHWDISWHAEIGRDGFVSPPHLMIIFGYAIALWGVDSGTRAAAQSPWRALVVRPGLGLAGGATLLSVAVLAFDNWWHTQFGVDITLWSPPHLLLATGFVLIVLGGVLELARSRGRDYASEAGALLLAVSTLVMFEFELGIPHRAMAWEPPVLALLFGFALGLASEGNRTWAGARLGAVTLALRAAAGAFNAAVGVPTPTLPVGAMAGGACFDVARRAFRASGARQQRALEIGLPWVAAWLGLLIVQGTWRFLAGGRTWWHLPELTVALPVGAIVGAGSLLAGRWFARVLAAAASGVGEVPSEEAAHLGGVTRGWGRRRFLVGAAAVSAVLVVSAVPVLGGRTASRPAGVSRDGRHIVVSIPGASGWDWVSVLGGERADPGRAAWVTSLDWDGQTFRGALSSVPPRPWYGLWYATGNETWYSPIEVTQGGAVTLRRQAFRREGPRDAVTEGISYALILLLASGQWALVVFASRRNATERSHHPSEVRG